MQIILKKPQNLTGSHKAAMEHKPSYTCLLFHIPQEYDLSKPFNLLAPKQHATPQSNLSDLSYNGLNHFCRCLFALPMERG